MSSNAQAEIAAQAELRTFAPGDILFHEGDRDNLLYFLLEGEILRHEAGGTTRRLSAKEDDACYALARMIPRVYTAEAATAVQVVCLQASLMEHSLCCDQATSYEVFEYDGSDDPSWMWDVLTQPAFRKVPPESINAMFTRFEAVSCSAGEVIIEQGAVGDYYYLIREGRARITRTSSDNLRQTLADIGKSESFGEDALLTGDPRNATVTMLTDGLLMRLSKQDFDQLLSAPLVHKVSAQDAESLLQSGYLAIDVRLEDEFRAGTIRNSLNLPLYLLRIKSSGLDQGKKYLLFCQNGQRSSAAAFLLAQRGFDVYVLDGGLNALASAKSA
jgi:CRP-like cAMP-binding protein